MKFRERLSPKLLRLPGSTGRTEPWEGKGRSGRWENLFWESLFRLRPLDAEFIERLVIGLVQETERAHATREAILRSPSQLAKAWWRAARWKLGIRRAPE